MHIAQANVALMRGGYEDPVMTGFVERLEPLNAVADASPGFVWRLVEEDDDDTSARVFGHPRTLLNMSVWESIDALENYVYRSVHVDAVRLRSNWLEPFGETSFVLWWVPEGHIPTIEEAHGRFETLWSNGPTAAAFTFRHRFAPESQEQQ